MKFSLALKQAREESGISEQQCAAIANLNPSWYGNLEEKEDEWFEVTPLVCTIPLINLFNIHWDECFDWPRGRPINQKKPLNESLREAREMLHLTPVEFSDICGFHPEFSVILESHFLGIFLYPPAVMVKVATTLKIDAADIIRTGIII